MSWYKIAQGSKFKKEEIVKKIFLGFEGGRLEQGNQVSDWSREWAFYDEGEAYVQIYFREDWETQTSYFGIEKYYNSEFMNEMLGKSMKITIDYENPENTLNQINNALKSLGVKWK